MDVNKKLQLIQKNLKKINGSLLQLNKNDIKKAYDKLPEAKKNLIRPIIESDEEYIANWYENHKGNSNTFPIDVNIYTEKGEQVRSKSEKILADLFNKHNIPYVYEPKIALTNGHMAYPDFAVLNIKERKTVYWEHLGLVDQTEYAMRNLNKISEYESTGIELGDNLIITMESSKKGFDTRSVEKKIEKFLG